MIRVLKVKMSVEKKGKKASTNGIVCWKAHPTAQFCAGGTPPETFGSIGTAMSVAATSTASLGLGGNVVEGGYGVVDPCCSLTEGIWFAVCLDFKVQFSICIRIDVDLAVRVQIGILGFWF
jgi:hypothetical protein